MSRIVGGSTTFDLTTWIAAEPRMGRSAGLIVHSTVTDGSMKQTKTSRMEFHSLPDMIRRAYDSRLNPGPRTRHTYSFAPTPSASFR